MMRDLLTIRLLCKSTANDPAALTIGLKEYWLLMLKFIGSTDRVDIGTSFEHYDFNNRYKDFLFQHGNSKREDDEWYDSDEVSEAKREAAECYDPVESCCEQVRRAKRCRCRFALRGET